MPRTSPCDVPDAVKPGRIACLFLVLALLAACASLAAPARSYADPEKLGPERITSFSSDITINKDASITVTETITAVVRGDKIKRGIYRDIPTVLSGASGLRRATPLDILEVSRNGQPSAYHTERQSDAAGTIRIYFGEKSAFLPQGSHTFEITYRSYGQLRYFATHDELYWNVTGNAWEFIIEEANCTVRLPDGSRLVQHAAYTGLKGALGRDYLTDLDRPRHPRFMTSRPLPPLHGLTIAVAWPKGHIPEPTTGQKAVFLFRANASTVTGLCGFLLLLGYYFTIWKAKGRDPQKGVIIPRFQPPAGLSPAATRMIMKMGFDNKTFAAAILNMAVKGFLTISESKSGLSKTFTLSRTDKSKEEAGLSRGESILAASLLGGMQTQVELNNASQSSLKKAHDRLQQLLSLEHEKIHFLKNQKYIFIGGAVTLITLGGMALFAPIPELAGFMSLWLSFWTVGVVFLVSSAVRAWRAGGWGGATFLSLFALPFILGELFGLGTYAYATSILSALAMLAMLGLSALFYVLMKAPTFAGRRLMDEIEGFKMYLEVAEKDRLELLHAPEVTPEIFERYLPYAMALDVENQWVQRFENALSRAVHAGAAYHPAWYRGTSFSPTSIGTFTGTFADSFAGALSSATSSGSGGGGSSGGGGGGGGGGGW